MGRVEWPSVGEGSRFGVGFGVGWGRAACWSSARVAYFFSPFSVLFWIAFFFAIMLLRVFMVVTKFCLTTTTSIGGRVRYITGKTNDDRDTPTPSSPLLSSSRVVRHRIVSDRERMCPHLSRYRTISSHDRPRGETFSPKTDRPTSPTPPSSLPPSDSPTTPKTSH